MSPKIMMSVAEVSADVHASYLAKELKGFQLFGMGGERMKAAGVDVRFDMTRKSSVGIIELLKNLGSNLTALKKLKKMLESERPDALILIDAQGLNMPLAEHAKKLGIKTIYYVAPQEWLWGTPKGVSRVARTIDLIISIFRREHEIYSAAGGNSYYVGNPLLDIAKPTISRSEFIKRHGLKEGKIISLCPGSREHEIKSLLPILIETARGLIGAQFILPVSSTVFRDEIASMIKASGMDIRLIEGPSFDALASSDLVIASSGTILLECVCLGVPVIMFYKLSLLTYYIAKYLLRVRLRYYSMPNILVDKPVIPEYVMEKATSANLISEAKKALADPLRIRSGYPEVLAGLGSKGAVRAYAEKISEFVKGS